MATLLIFKRVLHRGAHAHIYILQAQRNAKLLTVFVGLVHPFSSILTAPSIRLAERPRDTKG